MRISSSFCQPYAATWLNLTWRTVRPLASLPRSREFWESWKLMVSWSKAFWSKSSIFQNTLIKPHSMYTFSLLLNWDPLVSPPYLGRCHSVESSQITRIELHLLWQFYWLSIKSQSLNCTQELMRSAPFAWLGNATGDFPSYVARQALHLEYKAGPKMSTECFSWMFSFFFRR